MKTGWIENLLCAIMSAAALIITGCSGQCNRVTKVLTATLNWKEITPQLDDKGQYLSGQICHWRIEASPGHAVQVTVIKMDLHNAGPSTTICYDSVSLYDGRDLSSSAQLVELCQQSDVGREVYSSWQNMFVRFESDNYKQKTGFVIRYRAVPFGDLPLNVSTVKPQDDQEDDPGSDSSTTSGGIAGGTIAGICLLVLVWICSRYFNHRKRYRGFHAGAGYRHPFEYIDYILDRCKVTPATSGRIGNAGDRNGHPRGCSLARGIGHARHFDCRCQRSPADSSNQEIVTISDRMGVHSPRAGAENASGRSMQRQGPVTPTAPSPEHVYRDGNDVYNDQTVDNQHCIQIPNPHSNPDPDALTSWDGRSNFPGSHFGADSHQAQIHSPPFRGNLHVDPSIIGDAPPSYEDVVSNGDRRVASSQKEPPSYSNAVEMKDLER